MLIKYFTPLIAVAIILHSCTYKDEKVPGPKELKNEWNVYSKDVGDSFVISTPEVCPSPSDSPVSSMASIPAALPN